MNRDQLKQELETIQGRRQLLLAPDVVSWARQNPTSELYKHFCWDDKQAAEAFRLTQARELIKLVIETPPNSPQWISLSIDRSEDGGYRNAAQIEATPRLREVLVRDVLDEFVRLRTRYPRLREFAAIYAAIDRMAEKVEERKTA